MARVNILQYALIMLSVVVVAWFLVNYGATVSISTVVGSGVIAVFPGLLITFLGVITVAEAWNSPGVVGCFAIMGVGLAILLQEMYDAGIIVDAMLGGATIAQYETIVIIVGLLLGLVAYVSGRG